jgi:flagellar export protein FliJ
MDGIGKMRRLAQHRERLAQLELANAENLRAQQEMLVEQTSRAILGALGSQGIDPLDPLDQFHRHGYALRMEMERRGAQRRLQDRMREVGVCKEQVTAASREKGTYDRLIELRDAAEHAERTRVEQKQLDETGLVGWWRKED